MNPIVTRLLGANGPVRGDEQSATLLRARGLRLERIVSHGAASPEGFWYDQPEAEWVAVLAGRARLSLEGAAGEISLEPGDAILLPSRCRHRVSWTDPEQPTIWLCLFVDADLAPTLCPIGER